MNINAKTTHPSPPQWWYFSLRSDHRAFDKTIDHIIDYIGKRHAQHKCIYSLYIALSAEKSSSPRLLASLW